MAYLGKYIRQILSKQEPVILPGFGRLTISKSEGVSVESGKIDPPGVLIRFDVEHPRDNGKLAAEYAAGESIDGEEAKQQVLELVDAIKFKLDKGEKFSLDLVGEFTRDDDDRIHFVKDSNWIIDPDLFGLPSLDLLELEEEEKAPEPANEDSVPVKEDSIPQQKESQPMKKKMANRAPVNKWKIIWIIVGSLIIVLVLILLIPTKNSDYGIEFSKEGLVMKENVVSNGGGTVEDTNELVTDVDEQLEQTETETQEAVQAETQTPIGTTNNFFIIAGSFQELQNATELMESLKSEGFPAEIIITESRLYRVAVQSYPEKQQASDDLSRIKAHPGLGSCWVWGK
jgi:cell division septation protein DedD/nucleoid DNA-binding protein